MFITLEGPEGSGKSTQIRMLTEFLSARGQRVLATREPGGTAIGDQVRQVLMRLDNQEMHPRTEILLFQASRAQLVEQVIRPALGRGDVVVCDRYADSTLAYQGYGHGVDREVLRRLLDFATGGLKPDLTLLLDLDVETGLARKRGGEEWNRMDAYQVEFHRRVRQGYHEMAAADPRWVRIDAGQSIEAVQAQMRQAVAQRMHLERV